MGGGASKPKEKVEVPKGPTAPEWISEIRLDTNSLNRQNPLLKKEPEYRFELPDRFVQNEFARKAASECSRRCFHLLDQNNEYTRMQQSGTPLNLAE